MTSPTQPNRRHQTDSPCFHLIYHGLTCEDLDALYVRSGGHCEICGIAEGDTPRGMLVIDHFEARRFSFTRGLLCDGCNAVMSCVDGKKVWGENRKWEAQARAYEANSWEKPSPAALELMAARTEMQPKIPRRPMPDRSRLNIIAVPSRQGVEAMADRLRYYLTPVEMAELARLLLVEA